MKKRIAAIIILSLLAVNLICGTVMADPVPEGSVNAALQNEDYSDAGVVLDFYRVAVYGPDGYQWESGFSSLKGKYQLNSVDKMDAETLEALAQDAAKIVLSDSKPVSPVVSGVPLPVNVDPENRIEPLLLGFYLIIPHGEIPDYVKEIRNKIYTIAVSKTETFYFSPVLVSTDYRNPDGTVLIKAAKDIDPSIDTGDRTNPLPFIIAAAAAFVVIIVIVVIFAVRGKKKQK